MLSPCCHLLSNSPSSHLARNQLYDGRSAIQPASFAMGMAETSRGFLRLMGGSTGFDAEIVAGALVEFSSSNHGLIMRVRSKSV